MTRIIKILLIGALLGATFAAIQRTSVSAQDNSYKIGVANLQMIGNKYEKRKAKYAELQKQMEVLQAGVDQKTATIEAAKKDYEQKKDGLTAEAAATLELKIKSDIADNQAELTKSQLKIDSMQALMLQEVFKDIHEAIDQIAVKGNYHLVLDSAQGPGAAVLYSHNSIDVTAQILELLNKP